MVLHSQAMLLKFKLLIKLGIMCLIVLRTAWHWVAQSKCQP